MATGDEKKNADDIADATSRTAQNYEKLGKAFSKYLQDQEDSYDLARSFTLEIKKHQETLEKLNKEANDITDQLQKQVEIVEKQNIKVQNLQKQYAAAAVAMQEQQVRVAGISDEVRKLTEIYEEKDRLLKSTNADIKKFYDTEKALAKLESDKLEKQDALNRLQQRNIRMGEIREDLARRMEKAILSGNNAEAAAIKTKQLLLNNLISFNSAEIDAAKTRLDSYGKDIAATKQLLDSSREGIELKKKQAALLKQERADALLKLDSAKELLNSENRILKAKQNAFEKIKVEERKESDVLKKQQDTLQSMIDQYGPRLQQLKKEINVEEEIIKNLTTKKRIIGEIDSFLGQTSEYYGKTKALIMDIAKGGATAWLAVIKASLERWIELDRAALEFRKQTGFLVSQTKELDKAAREVNVQMANLGVNIEEAYAAAGALTEEFQVIGLVTKEAIANTAMVSANLGVSVTDSAKIKGMFESIAESTGTTGDGLIKSAAALAKMGGVAPRAVMKDIATASGATLSFLAKSPVALMRAAVEARRLGTTVANMSASARGFLNYQDSITSELEASALLGKALNFQEARAAAYAGDVVKSRELALRQIAKAGDFTKLNVYQQEALAKAAGMTVDEIIKQQNQQKLLAKLEATRPELYAKYKAMQDKLRENEKAAAGDLEKQAEEMAKQQLMQGEMNKLTNAFRAIWTDITDALLPIANVIMPILITTVRGLAVVFKVIGGLIRGLFSPIEKFFDSFRSGNESALKLEEIFAKIGPTVEKITAFAVGLTGTLMHAVTGVATMYAMMIPVVNIFSKLKISIGQAFQPFTVLSDMFTDIATRIENFAGRLRGLFRIFTPFVNMGSSVFKLFGMIAKFAGPIGLVVNVIQFAFSLFKRFSEMEWGDSIGENILLGIKAIGGALYDVLIQPFFDVWNWVSDKLMGKSPSKLGLGIVNGIKSIGSMLLNALTSPFKNAFNLISGIFSGRSGVGTKIVESLKSVGEFIFDALTWPFRQLIKFARKIPIIGKLFGGGNADNSIDISAEAKSKAEASAVPSIEVKGMPELKESIDKLTDAITKLGGAGGTAAPIVNVNNNPAAMVEKLDELITLLKDGSIGVNIDGIKASKVLARAST